MQMVDLKATNIKLKQRSRNIIRSIEPTALDVGDEELDQRIKACNGSVKLALMTLMSKLPQEDCQFRLESAGGILSKALQMLHQDTREDSKSDGKDVSENGQSELPKGNLSVCIDGGGTKCAVAVADEAGNTVRGEAGACN